MRYPICDLFIRPKQSRRLLFDIMYSIHCPVLGWDFLYDIILCMVPSKPCQSSNLSRARNENHFNERGTNSTTTIVRINCEFNLMEI